MIVIDGSEGQGGGQILRSSLALSMCTGRPFRIERIRAGRSKPGLMRRHLTAVQAATVIAGATTIGVEIGARHITFSPGSVRPGAYSFSVGTAGSAILVLQTVLPALLTASAPSQLVLEGGTHNPHAPPFEFLARAFVPLIARMGAGIDVVLERPGFAPAGGGRMRATITPSRRLSPLDLRSRGALRAEHAEALLAGVRGDVGVRELATLGAALGWPGPALQMRVLDDEVGPGNALLATLAYESVCEVFAGFGARGVGAEDLALQVAGRVRDFKESTAAVGPHLADQLLLPMALAGGGAFTTVTPSDHLRSNARVIETFLPLRIAITPRSDAAHLVEVLPAR